jgi:hypothetical protein
VWPIGKEDMCDRLYQKDYWGVTKSVMWCWSKRRDERRGSRRRCSGLKGLESSKAGICTGRAKGESLLSSQWGLGTGGWLEKERKRDS